MKLIIFLVVAGFLEVSATGYSQNISISGKDISLKKVFDAIKSQAGYVFFYDVDLINKAKPVTIDVRNAPVEKVLSATFKDQPLTWSIENKTITILKKENAQTLPQKVEAKPVTINIHGKVTDVSGRPLPSVSVVVPGTPLGTMTNQQGEYAISGVPENADLLFSYVGYEPKKVAIKDRMIINVVLQMEMKQLDETVIIGYGTTTKRKSTGSVSSITAKDIEMQPVANPLNALQGRIAGAIVNQANGLPGSRVTIQIRGRNSLDNGQQPLYIIDGVPFNIQDQAVPASNDLNSFGIYAANRGLSPFSTINPADIERIDVLKDADATAIYGTRGANGVVLITTKKGKAGKTKVDINVYRGAGKISRFIDMMNISEYLQMRRDAYKNDGITPNAVSAPDLFVWDSDKNTDWQKKYLGGTANTTDAQASISGGDTRTRFLFSTGYHKETTVYPGDFGSSRFSARINADHNSLDKKFNANVSVNYSFDKTNLLSTDLASAVYNLPPNMPLYNSDGSLLWNGNFTNPESYLLQKYIGQTSNMISNALLRYTILPGLELKTNLGFNRVTLDQNQQSPAISKNPFNGTPTSSARFASLDQQGYIIEPQTTYTKSIGDGTISALIGGTWQSTENKGTSINGANYSNPDLLGTISGAGLISSATASYTLYNYNSFFGRLNYDWKSKYILNGVIRRDGSSRFGADHRFGTFWSVGGAWLFSKEKFISDALNFLSFGKIRGSYGLTGNDQIQDYQYLTLFSITSGNGGYQGSSVLSPSRINNPELHWETNKKMEFGLDLGFLSDRILLTTDYYRNRTGNQLGYLHLSSQSGFNSYVTNFDAVIENTGWEFEVNTTNIKTKNFEWKTSFNLTIPQTKLLSASPQYFYYNQASLGKPLSYVQRFIFKGVDPETGQPLYLDGTKDSLTFTPNFSTDRRIIGYSAPSFYGGISNTLSYKGFELSFFFQFTRQEGNILTSGIPGSLSSGNANTNWLNRWQQPGDNAVLPKASTFSDFNYGSSDAIWGDASFARLRNLNISYSLPARVVEKLKMSNCRVYVQGQNIYTWTKNKYVSDPETITTINQSPVVMPPLKIITAGINCSF